MAMSALGSPLRKSRLRNTDRPLVAPEILEPIRRKLGVSNRVLNISMSQIGLQAARIGGSKMEHAMSKTFALLVSYALCILGTGAAFAQKSFTPAQLTERTIERRAEPDTLGGYMLFRANLKSHGDADVQVSIAGKRMKIYPLAQAANPPPTVFTDAIAS
jgi:hypothetical protein